MNSRLYVPVLEDVFIVSPWSLPPLVVFHLALEYEQNSYYDCLTLMCLHPFCLCFPTKTLHSKMHIQS
jgi:hypothetical protein